MSDAPETPTRRWSELAAKIGIDWGAVLVAGVFAVLAVAGLLPKIPW